MRRRRRWPFVLGLLVLVVGGLFLYQDQSHPSGRADVCSTAKKLVVSAKAQPQSANPANGDPVAMGVWIEQNDVLVSDLHDKAELELGSSSPVRGPALKIDVDWRAMLPNGPSHEDAALYTSDLRSLAAACGLPTDF